MGQSVIAIDPALLDEAIMEKSKTDAPAQTWTRRSKERSGRCEMVVRRFEYRAGTYAGYHRRHSDQPIHQLSRPDSDLENLRLEADRIRSQYDQSCQTNGISMGPLPTTCVSTVVKSAWSPPVTSSIFECKRKKRLEKNEPFVEIFVFSNLKNPNLRGPAYGFYFFVLYFLSVFFSTSFFFVFLIVPKR